MIAKVLKWLFDSSDHRFNSKILSVVVALILLVFATIMVLFGIPPVTATYITDLIWGLVTIIIGGSGIEVANQFIGRKSDIGEDEVPE
jgi:hypothetical protein